MSKSIMSADMFYLFFRSLNVLDKYNKTVIIDEARHKHSSLLYSTGNPVNRLNPGTLWDWIKDKLIFKLLLSYEDMLIKGYSIEGIYFKIEVTEGLLKIPLTWAFKRIEYLIKMFRSEIKYIRSLIIHLTPTSDELPCDLIDSIYEIHLKSKHLTEVSV